MIEAIHEKSQACAACSLEKGSMVEMQIFFIFDFFLKITGLLTSCLLCSVHVRTFLGFFSWQCSHKISNV